MVVPATAVDGFLWGVKSSFRNYVAAVGGTVELIGGAVATSMGYRFQAIPSDDPAELSFSGGVRFCAHGGLLAVTINAPRLRRTADAVEISVETHAGRIPVAVGPAMAAGSLDVGPLRLLDSACGVFDFSYPAGTPLDAARLLGR